MIIRKWLHLENDCDDAQELNLCMNAEDVDSVKLNITVDCIDDYSKITAEIHFSQLKNTCGEYFANSVGVMTQKGTYLEYILAPDDYTIFGRLKGDIKGTVHIKDGTSVKAVQPFVFEACTDVVVPAPPTNGGDGDYVTHDELNATLMDYVTQSQLQINNDELVKYIRNYGLPPKDYSTWQALKTPIIKGTILNFSDENWTAPGRVFLNLTGVYTIALPSEDGENWMEAPFVIGEELPGGGSGIIYRIIDTGGNPVEVIPPPQYIDWANTNLIYDENTLTLTVVIPAGGEGGTPTAETDPVYNAEKSTLALKTELAAYETIAAHNADKIAQAAKDAEQDARLVQVQTDIDMLVMSQNADYVEVRYVDLPLTGVATNANAIVLLDETHSNLQTVYTWSGTAWDYRGSQTPTYTKAEIDALFSQRDAKILALEQGQAAQDLAIQANTDAIEAISATSGQMAKLTDDNGTHKPLPVVTVLNADGTERAVSSVNAALEYGGYSVYADTVGAPSVKAGHLWVMKHDSGGISQEYIDFDNIQYSRLKSGTTWGDWKKEGDGLVPYTGATTNVNFNQKNILNAQNAEIINGALYFRKTGSLDSAGDKRFKFDSTTKVLATETYDGAAWTALPVSIVNNTGSVGVERKYAGLKVNKNATNSVYSITTNRYSNPTVVELSTFVSSVWIQMLSYSQWSQNVPLANQVIGTLISTAGHKLNMFGELGQRHTVRVIFQYQYKTAGTYGWITAGLDDGTNHYYSTPYTVDQGGTQGQCICTIELPPLTQSMITNGMIVSLYFNLSGTNASFEIHLDKIFVEPKPMENHTAVTAFALPEGYSIATGTGPGIPYTDSLLTGLDYPPDTGGEG